eukprot:gene27562-33288_t
MSQTSSPSCSQGGTPTKNFKRLHNRDLDCPNLSCNGWLIEYGFVDSEEPAFIKCSNRGNPDPDLRCQQPTIYSKKESTCPICHESFPLMTVITMMSPGIWAHAKCSIRVDGQLPPHEAVVSCQRCRNPIPSSATKVPSTIGEVAGYIHESCQSKKKRVCPTASTACIEDAPLLPAATKRRGTK